MFIARTPAKNNSPRLDLPQVEPWRYKNKRSGCYKHLSS
jgi:hypothetical protein